MKSLSIGPGTGTSLISIILISCLISSVVAQLELQYPQEVVDAKIREPAEVLNDLEILRNEETENERKIRGTIESFSMELDETKGDSFEDYDDDDSDDPIKERRTLFKLIFLKPMDEYNNRNPKPESNDDNLEFNNFKDFPKISPDVHDLKEHIPDDSAYNDSDGDEDDDSVEEIPAFDESRFPEVIIEAGNAKPNEKSKENSAVKMTNYLSEIISQEVDSAADTPENSDDDDSDEVAENGDIAEENLVFYKSRSLQAIDEERREKKASNESNEDHRCAPSARNSGLPYVLSEERLKAIRSEKMYWYFDKCGDNDRGDYQSNLHSSMPQIYKNFTFELPFYGLRYNYTRLSMHGYFEFTDPPRHYTHPLVFPVKDWPKENDPAFIGIFFSKCRIGSLRSIDVNQQAPGVYFRKEEFLRGRTDQFGVELRERVKLDIREGRIGADSFDPNHVLIATWKNVSFAGGIEHSLYRTNTFQIVLATDESSTFVIFNYDDIQWTTHTEAGGDTFTGEGGVPAFVGFNAGNGRHSYEYKPYSQSSLIRDLLERGGANGFPGRHIFRIDEETIQKNAYEHLLRRRYLTNTQ